MLALNKKCVQLFTPRKNLVYLPLEFFINPAATTFTDSHQQVFWEKNNPLEEINSQPNKSYENIFN